VGRVVLHSALRVLHLHFVFARHACFYHLHFDRAVALALLPCVYARRALIPHMLRRSRASYVARSDAFLHVAFASCASCSGYACCSCANLRRVQFCAPTYRRSLSCLWGASFPSNNYSATSQTASRELYLTWWSSFFFCKEKKVSLRVASCSHV